jgi:glucan phosphorylase
VIKKYFSKAAELLGISITNLLNLAKSSHQDISMFSMTALALKYTIAANAVSKIQLDQVRENNVKLETFIKWRNEWRSAYIERIKIKTESILEFLHLFILSIFSK